MRAARPGRDRGEPLLAGPLPRTAGRALTIAGGLLLLAGAFLPWVVVPLGRARLPLPGLLGPGGITLLVGLLFLRWPRLHPLAGLGLATAVGLLASPAGDELARQVRGILLAMQMRIFPLNRLLEQFHIEGITVVELGRPRIDYLGPGLAATLWGAGVAAAGSLIRLFTVGEGAGALQDRLLPRSCPECRVAIPRSRGAAFCPACGFWLGGPSRCPGCAAPAEPSDQYCVACGTPLRRQ